MVGWREFIGVEYSRFRSGTCGSMSLRFYLHHWSTQSVTVFHQRREFCGFKTQWPSSGKYNIFDGTLSRWSVVKSWKPSETSSRKSSGPWTTSAGGLNFLAERRGE